MRHLIWSSTLKGAEISMLIGKIALVPCLGLAVLMTVAGIRLIQLGGSPRYWLLLAGSTASIVVLFAFLFQVTDKNRRGRRGLVPMIFVFGVFIPYLFGCYLFFYEGLWRFFGLAKGFSARSLILASLFTFLGYAVVNATYKSTEFARKLENGDIQLLDN